MCVRPHTHTHTHTNPYMSVCLFFAEKLFHRILAGERHFLPVPRCSKVFRNRRRSPRCPRRRFARRTQGGMTRLHTDAAETFHTALWSTHTWPSGTLVSISSRSHSGGRPRAKRILVSDGPEAFARAVSEMRGDVWANVAPVRPETKRRGGREDSLSLPALFADLDTSDGAHKLDKDGGGRPLPTRQELVEILKGIPFGNRLMLVDTGGGVHAYLLLENPLDWRSDDGADILARWKHYWVGALHGAGRAIDEGVLADVPRMLRVPGTHNHKTDPPRPVRLVRPGGDRASVGELLGWLPPVPARRPTQSAAKGGTNRNGSPDRPGDRLATSVPISGLVVALYGGDIAPAAGGLSRWTAPDASGDNDHAVFYPPDDADELPCERMTVYSERVKREWGLPTGTNVSWSSWDYLCHRCGGDARLAARVAVQHPTLEDLVEFLDAYGTPADVATASATISTSLTELLDGASLSASSIPLELPDDLQVVIGGPDHGLWHLPPKADEDGGPSPRVRVTDWVAWRPRSVEQLTAIDGAAVEVAETLWDVEFIDARLRRQRIRGLTSTQSVAVSDLVARCHQVVVSVPSRSPSDRFRTRVMLDRLGAPDRVRDRTWTATGWAVIEGKATFLAPAGSVEAQGPTEGHVVGPPAGSTGINALPAACRHFGFQKHDSGDDLASASSSVRGLIDVAPSRPELGLSLLGGLMAAPLRLKKRCAVVVTAEPGTGKTLSISAAQAFVSGVGVSNSSGDFPLAFSDGSVSDFGARTLAAWHQDAPLFADDFRLVDNDSMGNRMREKTVTALIQAAYGGGNDIKGTNVGGLRGSAASSPLLILTAESGILQRAIAQRCVEVRLAKGDIPQGENAGIDIFSERWGRTGLARHLYASYLSWLASRMDAVGIAEFTADTNRTARDLFQKLRGSRAGETVAVLLTGLHYFYLFAEEHGIVGSLPPRAEVVSITRNLADAQVRIHAEADPGERVIDRLIDLLANDSVHLVDHNLERPRLGRSRRSPGWTCDDREHDRWSARNQRVGVVSSDSQFVVVTNEGIRAVARSADMADLPPKTVKMALAAHMVGLQATAGGFAPRNLGIPSRPRGVTLPIGLLLPEMESDTDDAATDEELDF